MTIRFHAAIEALEPRRLASVATSTSLTPSDTSFRFGDTIDLTIAVKARSGSATPKGSIALYNGSKNTGITAALDSTGQTVIDIDASRSLPVGSYHFSAHYIPKGSFVASHSAASSVTITTPRVDRTTSDGIALSVLTIGSGAAVAKGNTITVELTAYDSKGKRIASTYTAKSSTTKITVFAKPEQVVKGLDEALVGMHTGETLVAQIPSKLAYGDGRKITYVVRLMGIKA